MKENLYRYITGIVQARNHKMLAINGMPDHVHMLINYRPTTPLPDLMRDVKSFSSKHVNEQNWVRGRFAWQEGYGAFSYSRSAIPTVIRYIENQEAHHRSIPFREEYLGMLREFDVPADERYIFRWDDDA
jgi:REP element-mobilizing transposase RayT